MMTIDKGVGGGYPYRYRHSTGDAVRVSVRVALVSVRAAVMSYGYRVRVPIASVRCAPAGDADLSLLPPLGGDVRERRVGRRAIKAAALSLPI